MREAQRLFLSSPAPSPHPAPAVTPTVWRTILGLQDAQQTWVKSLVNETEGLLPDKPSDKVTIFLSSQVELMG